MTIKAQFGILGIYDSLEKTEIRNSDNETVIASFLNTKLPPIQFMTAISVFYQVNLLTGVTVSLMRYSNDQQILTNIAFTAENEVTYFRVKCNGGTVSALPTGYYYYKIVVAHSTPVTYYSDTFNLIDSISGFLYLKLLCSDFSLGRKQEYRVKSTGITYECYFRVHQYNGIEIQNEEDANEEDGEIQSYYTGISIYREFIIEGKERIFKFLLSLRTLLVNGEMDISYGGETYSDVGDSTAELESKSGDFDIVNIRFKFVSANDIITPINTID